MKLQAIIFLISSATILHKALTNGAEEELKCETEGCYEVIKTFVRLLEEKINETDKVSFVLAGKFQSGTDWTLLGSFLAGVNFNHLL